MVDFPISTLRYFFWSSIIHQLLFIFLLFDEPEKKLGISLNQILARNPMKRQHLISFCFHLFQNPPTSKPFMHFQIHSTDGQYVCNISVNLVSLSISMREATKPHAFHIYEITLLFRQFSLPWSVPIITLNRYRLTCNNFYQQYYHKLCYAYFCQQ